MCVFVRVATGQRAKLLCSWQPCRALVCRSACPVQLPRLALVSILELHAHVWLQRSLGKRGHTH